MKTLNFELENLSAMHLGSGKADVLVDAEIVRDKYGLPYFPARRLKGLLYESAMEMAEISNETWFTLEEVDMVFGHKGAEAAGFILENLYLQDYEKLINEWEYLQHHYPMFFNANTLLDSYTQLRYQTSLDEETGIALDGSLHNIRVLDPGNHFIGKMIITGNESLTEKIFAKAVPNLRYVGAKRNRGFGKVKCSLKAVEKGGK